jgi:hypothetical protein
VNKKRQHNTERLAFMLIGPVELLAMPIICAIAGDEYRGIDP